jgi:hypothetical protein
VALYRRGRADLIYKFVVYLRVAVVIHRVADR